MGNEDPWRVSEPGSDVMKTVIKDDEMRAGQMQGKGGHPRGGRHPAREVPGAGQKASLFRREATVPQKLTPAGPEVTSPPPPYHFFFFFPSFYDLTIFGKAKINQRGAEQFH